MIRKFLIASVVFVVTLLVSLLTLRTFAPQLLGMPADLTIVRSSERVAPFFKSVFTEGVTDTFFINDPLTIVRGVPSIPEFAGVGPHDLLGFRNRSVPNTVEVLVLGDSQTYGINASHSQSWPTQLRNKLSGNTTVYSAALGGWAAMQYVEMFHSLAKIMQPRVVLVLFYAGNDALESFKAAYAIDSFRSYRLDNSLSVDDLPAIPFPPKERWPIQLEDGQKRTLAPKHRLLSNGLQSKVVQAGYGIMQQAALDMHRSCVQYACQLVVSLMPTAELVYKNQIPSSNSSEYAVYTQYVAAESHYRERFELFVKQQNIAYIDVLPALHKAASENVALYPEKFDGHPTSKGYAVVADVIHNPIRQMLEAVPPLPQGLVKVYYKNRLAVYTVQGTKAIPRRVSDITQEKIRDAPLIPIQAFARLRIVDE